MNYYRFYPGDYAGDTQHLSVMEHGVYFLLLNYCYSKEAFQLPESMDSIYRICRAVTPEEQSSARSVVAEFFPGRRNPRVQVQLQEEVTRIDLARQHGRKGNEIRWGKDRDCVASPTAHSDTQPHRQPDTQPDAGGDTQPHRSPITHSHTIPPTPTPTPTPNAEGLKSKPSLLCAELCANSAQTPAPNGSGLFLKTCKKGEEWEVPADKVAEWEENYPDVDVRLTLLGIRQWLNDNPGRRKTKRGMVRFIGAWMMREQDKPDPSQYAKTKH